MKRALTLSMVLLAIAALTGCASRPINERIAQVDPKSGYRPYLLIPKRQNNDPLEELAASSAFRGEIGFGVVRRIVLLVVNSHSSPSTRWDQVEAPPGTVIQLLQASGVPIDRFSFETVETLKDRAEIVKWRRDLLVAQKRLAGEIAAQAEASVPKITLNVVDVSFDAIRDPKERAYFMNLPTSFVLTDEQVDRLRDVAGQLMRQSADYEAVVRELGGTPAE
jgi:NTE family protein